MNITLFGIPALPGTSAHRVSARFVLLSIDAASTERSSRLDNLVVTASPREKVTGNSNQAPSLVSEDEVWTEATNKRRCELINLKYAGGLTPDDARELARLQALMLRHRQRIAPLPIEAARRLYEELLAAVKESRAKANP